MKQKITAAAKTGGLPAVPGWSKFMYSFGYVGTSVVDRVVTTWLMYYYVQPKGNDDLPMLVPPAVFGIMFFIGRALDTIIDPTIGFLTDRCKSPRGRRMPFMLYGGLPLVIAMVLLFFPPVHGLSVYNSIYLCVMVSIFFFFFSFYVCPYLGLLPELARTPEERINLTSIQGLFMLIGTVVATVLSPLLIKPLGFKGMAIVMGAIALVSFYSPVFGVNEKKYCVAEPSSLSMVETIVSTLKNKPFVIYLCGNLTFWFGFNIITTCLPYYVNYLLGLPESSNAIYFALALGISLVCIPLCNMLTRAIGKRNTMIFALVMFLILLPQIYFFNAPWLPIPKVPFSYIIIALAGIPLSCLFIVPNALVADLTDLDEKATGLRREAIYFGSQGLFQKITLGLSQLLMSALFQWYGFSAAQPLGIKLTGFVGGLFALIGIIAFMFFPKDLNAYAAKHPEMYKHKVKTA
ncbi:MAG: MFS transporter [bacterium]